ncbi:MarR family winged helix-turn-helix transcriptional regulator [Flagellimonas sp. S3867]|uniref:MarR family winged helix-turn-helix transcriptional regulator n=1 Tax=Flagellimonas sp. S3867 TaxID=2768063 RepID=UPI0016856B03|nr:MarR family transcriptional regulator [Flagellimonas sp. S3867]
MSSDSKYPNIDQCNPSACISGNIMKCKRIIANIFRKHLRPFGITDSQLSILFVITKANSVNQKRISEKLHMEKSTVNRNLTRLIEKEYISTDDESVLFTTENGKEFLEGVLPHWNNAMAEVRGILEKDGENAINLILNKLSG